MSARRPQREAVPVRRGVRAGRLVLALALGAALGHPSPAAGETSGLLPLTGELRIVSCPHLHCPVPPVDDPGWTSLPLGPAGIASSLNQQEGLAWVSVRFTLPAGARFERPTLLVTHPADAEEAFLNGVPAGGLGAIKPRYAGTVAGPRVLPLPAAALREGVNEVTFFSLLAGRNARFYMGPFLLGEPAAVEAERERLLLPIVATEAAFFSMFILVFVFYGFLVLKRVVRSDYLFFMAFIALHALSFLLGSTFLHRNQVVDAGCVHAQAVLGSLRTLVMLGLVTHATDSRFGAVFRLFAGVGAGFLALDLLLPPLTALTALDAPRKTLLGALGVYYLVVSGRAVRQQREDAVPVLTGVALYVAGSRIDLFWGIAVRDYAIAAFALCMLFALTSRHARLRNRIELVSARLLDAHEVERRRIARDIHDGVGQSLLALRLKLQKLAAAAGRGGGATARPPLDALAADTGVILEEVRRLSMDLRPSFVESMSLKDLLQWYGSSFAEARGLDFNIRDGSVSVPDPGPRVKDNLYRIYQEILTNIAKHAAAARVEVSLHREGRFLVLQVADDGRGFAEAGAGGIGLETMRERAELIGGTCRYDSAPGRGTKVRVEVEVP
jgi:signal transduction histidine kinase